MKNVYAQNQFQSYILQSRYRFVSYNQTHSLNVFFQKERSSRNFYVAAYHASVKENFVVETSFHSQNIWHATGIQFADLRNLFIDV